MINILNVYSYCRENPELIENHLYYERPACELIFLTKSAHQVLHKRGVRSGQIPWNKGLPWTKEIKEKISIAKLGTKLCFTEEHKQKIAKARMGTRHSDETKKKMSESQKKRYKHTEVF